jgi:CheY-like chemotaxis protein
MSLPESGVTGSGAGRRILLVDDSLLVQRMIREYFEPAGFQVTIAGNGREGLEAARLARPDVIVADIIMPVMDGWEFCEAVRKDPALANVPFLFLTAVREVPQRIQGLRMGADDYITKPFSRDELLARVEVCLAKSERLQQAAVAVATVLAGHTSHLPISDLLQLLSQNGKTGVLHLHVVGDREGKVFFRAGKVVNAATGAVEGRKALYRLLDWPEARFEMDPEGEIPPGEQIRESTSNVLMDGFTQNDELRALGPKLPASTTRFRAPGSAADLPAGTALGTTEKSVLLEFQHGATLHEALDHSPLNDLEVCRAILKLLQLNLLAPADTEAGAAG